MTLKKALIIAQRKGYVRCYRKDHGLGKAITTGDGREGRCRFMICPMVQVVPMPTFQYLSVKDFIKAAEQNG